MELPILKIAPTASPADLLRHFHKLAHDFDSSLAEAEALDAGSAFYNPSLPDVPAANGMVDAAIPPGASADDVMRSVDAFYAAKGLRCRRWVTNPSSPVAHQRSLAAALATGGYERQASRVLHLSRRPNPTSTPFNGLTILPARSAYRHARALTGETAANAPAPAQFAEADMLHLDDPRYDAMIALLDGVAVARVGVLAVGDLGLVVGPFVVERLRGRGVGATMLARALETCARSQFRQVLTSVDPANAGANTLHREFGFEPVGEFVGHVAPARPA